MLLPIVYMCYTMADVIAIIVADVINTLFVILYMADVWSKFGLNQEECRKCRCSLPGRQPGRSAGALSQAGSTSPPSQEGVQVLILRQAVLTLQQGTECR